MATIYTYKSSSINSIGMWIKSADGGPEIYLEPAQARKLAESILAQAQPAQRSAAPARTVQRLWSSAWKAPVAIQRSAPTTHTPIRETGTRTFTGKSSFTDEKWKNHAVNLAKTRAEHGYKQLLQRLQAEGKVCDVRAKGAVSVKGNSASYTITAVME